MHSQGNAIDTKPFWFDSRFAIVTVFLITLLGSAIRFYNLDWQCLMVDEMVTREAAARSISDIVTWSLSVDYNPPLYYMLAHWSVQIFGDTNFAIRFPAAVCGTLTIPLMFLLGKNYFGSWENPRGYLLGYSMAAVSAVMFPFTYYSQNARAYSLAVMFFVCFLIFWIQTYHSGFTPIRIFGIGGSIACCLMSHYYAGLPIVILMLWLLWWHRGFGKENEMWLYSIATALLILLPSVMKFDIAQFSSRTNHGIFNVLWNTPGIIAATVTNEMLCWSLIVIVPLSIYCVYRYRKEEPAITPLAVTALLIPFALLPMSTVTAVMPRYAIFATPIFILLACYPVASYADAHLKDNGQKIALMVLLVLVVAALNFGSIYQQLTYSLCVHMATVL
jgi:4-amino-4-deoxy-L-arabinose transferase-like glycosyltransferase